MKRKQNVSIIDKYEFYKAIVDLINAKVNERILLRMTDGSEKTADAMQASDVAEHRLSLIVNQMFP